MDTLGIMGETALTMPLLSRRGWGVIWDFTFGTLQYFVGCFAFVLKDVASFSFSSSYLLFIWIVLFLAVPVTRHYVIYYIRLCDHKQSELHSSVVLLQAFAGEET